jgi:hypothetical protein
VAALDAGNVFIAQEIALHEPLSGIGAAAAAIGIYSRDTVKMPRGAGGGPGPRGKDRARSHLGGD